MADAALLSVRGLTRRFGGLTAVGDVDLDLHEGEVHAVIGTNGAGKSTLVNMLSGELAASAGRIALAGQDVTRMPQPRRARDRLDLGRGGQCLIRITRQRGGGRHHRHADRQRLGHGHAIAFGKGWHQQRACAAQ